MRKIGLFAMSFLLVFTGCGSGTGTGNPKAITLQVSAYSQSILAQFLRTAHADVSSLTLCFKRLRFKRADVTDDDEDNVDLNIGEKTLSSGGTDLGEITIPENVYKRVEVDLEDSCSGKSLEVTNDNGTFSTDDRITVKFEGTFTVDSATTTVTLGIQSIVNALNNIDDGDEIRDAAEDAGGSVN